MSALLETEVRESFMQTGTTKMLCCKHGGSRVKLLCNWSVKLQVGKGKPYKCRHLMFLLANSLILKDYSNSNVKASPSLVMYISNSYFYTYIFTLVFEEELSH